MNTKGFIILVSLAMRVSMVHATVYHCVDGELLT